MTQNKLTQASFSSILKFTRLGWKTTMTVRTLHEKSGLSHPYISQLENGKRDRLPSPEIILKLATGFGDGDKQIKNAIYILFMSACNYIAVSFDSINKVSSQIKLSESSLSKFKILLGNFQSTKMAAFRFYISTLGFDEVAEATDEQLLDQKYQLHILKKIENEKSSFRETNAYVEGVNNVIDLNLLESKLPDGTFYLDNILLTETDKQIILGSINTVRNLRKNNT